MRYEFLKLFINRKILIAFVGMFALNIFLATMNWTVMYEGFNSKVYEYYMDKLHGMYSEEKYEYVMSEYKNMQELIKSEDNYLQQYKSKNISVSEYKKISKNITDAKSRIKTMEYIVEKTEYYSMCKYTPDYFYDIDINDYVRNMSINIPLLICLILIVSLIFCEDYYSNTVSMICSSKNGKSVLYFRRIICVCICSVVLSVIFYIGELVAKILSMNLGDLNSNISSLMCMKDTTLNISILEYIIFTILCRIFFVTIVGIIFSVIAIYTRKYIVMFIISLGVIYIPQLLTDSQLLISKGMEVYPLSGSSKRIFGYPIICVSVVVYLVLGFVLFSVGYFLTKDKSVQGEKISCIMKHS